MRYKLSVLTISMAMLHAYAQTFPIDPRETIAKHFPLGNYDNIDLYHVVDIPSARWAVIAERYSFHVYDTKTAALSDRLIPAKHQYESEDAITGVLSGFSFFDDERFLFGHVQAYGIFCYVLSDTAPPKELHRFALSDNNQGMHYDNQGEYHLFLHPKKNGRWDILIARSDVDSVAKNINRLYARFKEIRYALEDVPILSDQQGEPLADISPDGTVNIKQQNGTILINLVTGQVVE